MICECGSDDFDIIAKLLVTEWQGKIPNYYNEGIFLCKHCGRTQRKDGIDIDEEDAYYSVNRVDEDEELPETH